MTKYLFILTIISQIFNFILSVDEGYDDVITQICLGKKTDLSHKFQNNVDSLLSLFIYNSYSSHSVFFNTTAGDGSNMVYGSFLCRGDRSSRRCRKCLKRVKKYVNDRQLTDNYSNCFAYNMHLKCIIHYTNSSKPLQYEKRNPFTYGRFGDPLTLYPNYDATLKNIKQELVKEASYGNWVKPNFMTKVVGVEKSHEKVYILVQCMPYLSAINCSDCLSRLGSPDTKAGLILHFGNCFMNYNNESFFSRAYLSFMPNYLCMILVVLLTMQFTFL